MLLVWIYRDKKRRINSRKEVEKLLSDKVYEQAIGFLRITEGDNILDSTGIHPESYKVVLELLKSLDMDLSDVGSKEKIKKSKEKKRWNKEKMFHRFSLIYEIYYSITFVK